MFQIDSASRVPIYEQLKHSVIQLAATGVLKPDDQLPPVRALALQLGINPNTVAKAYRELESEGFTYSVAGKGSFISPTLSAHNALQRKVMTDFAELCLRARGLGIDKQLLHSEVDRHYSGGENHD